MKPEFSEAQLQQVTNIAIVRAVQTQRPDLLLMPNIPTLLAEYELGWDTAFLLPWMGTPTTEYRCNLFIQYKLSKSFDSRAKEWQYWNEPFLCFPFYHKKQNNIHDLHQRDTLITLSTQTTVIYVTNHILTLNELNNLYVIDKLTTTLPVLEVSSQLQYHTKVSFTPSSDLFKLHSEISSCERIDLNRILKKLKKVHLAETLTLLIRIIQQFEEEMEFTTGRFQDELDKLDKFPQMPKKFLEFLLIKHFLRRYFNLEWFSLLVR